MNDTEEFIIYRNLKPEEITILSIFGIDITVRLLIYLCIIGLLCTWLFNFGHALDWGISQYIRIYVPLLFAFWILVMRKYKGFYIENYFLFFTGYLLRTKQFVR